MAKRRIMQRGLRVPCPYCRDTEARIVVDLSNTQCTCESCGEEFAPEVGRNMIAKELRKWDALVSWFELGQEVLAPVQDDADHVGDIETDDDRAEALALVS
jgi:ribosomal protein S27E